MLGLILDLNIGSVGSYSDSGAENTVRFPAIIQILKVIIKKVLYCDSRGEHKLLAIVSVLPCRSVQY